MELEKSSTAKRACYNAFNSPAVTFRRPPARYIRFNYAVTEALYVG